MLERELIESAMRRALDIARRGPELNENPMVGCAILAPDGRIVAEGWHRGAGTNHAEIEALAALPAEWRDRPAELTAVVTLEPCNHTGRTGPCAVALAEFGIGAVAYALGDPGDASSGGAATLAAAGVEVLPDVLPDQARDLLAGWLARRAGTAEAPDLRRSGHDSSRRPHVTVKWAQSLDGRAAAADGTSQWITSPEARAHVHARRAEADAILVGTGTLLADDPSLTARDAGGELLVPAGSQPVPVVLGRREIPAGARILSHPALAARGLDAPIRLTGEDLAQDFASLAERGIDRVFVEGGPTVASALIAAGLADEVLVYVAPALLGGPRLALGDLGIASMRGIVRLRDVSVERLGPDLLVSAVLAHEAEEEEEGE
ncbi:bifunctional diaminohydroxyphosphoribosylaminopyrimidine deaminase/5-amino-6-(5-phosphoribosylamino)uracil reductase RibD [Leucobacter luti]|uniref:bifunctional diaminohydroxyphosphoribosylaminopyrimidine deaminase/5-amino-6-(5-phosphoribosylamino)uracil reductase RibD n=1 Tax=Leucobacter luti TaxID=340320 RepID=UPI003D0081BA